MLNKLLLIFLFFSINSFACTQLNNLSIYSDDTKTISLNYIQSFEGINKPNVEGRVFYEKPNLFKIITYSPSQTELIVNDQDVYRTDFALNETIKYKLENIESQIPALLLLKSRQQVCKNSEFISDVKLINDREKLKTISYLDQFGVNTQINFLEIKLNDEIDKRIFDYNKDTVLVILN